MPPSRPRGDRLRVVLISPKGPLYRHRGGLFGQTLRYMPLTFPTLAALIPKDVPVDLTCVDEGIGDVDLDLEADLIGMTVITGTSMRAYELSAHFRRRGIPVVLGGPHITLAPEDAAPHADSIVVGYAEESWPQLLRDFAAGRMGARYDMRPGLDLSGSPLPDRSVLPRWRYLTADVFESTRGCIHTCDFCVVPSAWGLKPYQKPVELTVEDLRRRRARNAIFIDLNLIADKAYAAQLFEALIPLRLRWFGLATTLLADDLPLLDLAARSGCRGLLMGLESISRTTLRGSRKGFNDPARYKELVEKLHARQIALQGCFVFGLDEDRPDVFRKTAEFAVEAKIDLPRFAIVTPFPGTTLYQRLAAEGRILTQDWTLYDGQHAVFQPAHMDPKTLYEGTELAWKTAYSLRNTWRRIRHTAAPPHVALLTNHGYRRYAKNLHRFYTCDAPVVPTWPRREPEPERAVGDVR
jgi:radical SAM superfamily enzyme YgiQ (UPF0313 family)